MAVIGAPHGIRGELRVKSFAAEPEALGDYGPLSAKDGRRFTVKSARSQGNVVVVAFREVADRTAAEALSGLELFVPRAALPNDLEEEEFYQTDLVGLAVFDEAGEAFGTVVALHDFGAGDIIEIAPPSGRPVMVPFTRAAVPEVDVAAGRLTIDREAAGLAGDGDEASGEEREG